MTMKHDAPDVDWAKISKAVKEAGFTVAEVLASFEKWRNAENAKKAASTTEPKPVRVDKSVPLNELARVIAGKRGNASILMIELTHVEPKKLDAQSSACLNNVDCDPLTTLEAIVALLRETHSYYAKSYAMECLMRGVVPKGDGGS